MGLLGIRRPTSENFLLQGLGQLDPVQHPSFHELMRFSGQMCLTLLADGWDRCVLCIDGSCKMVLLLFLRQGLTMDLQLLCSPTCLCLLCAGIRHLTCVIFFLQTFSVASH